MIEDASIIKENCDVIAFVESKPHLVNSVQQNRSLTSSVLYCCQCTGVRDGASSFHCDNCDDELYCSPECTSNSYTNGHWITCANGKLSKQFASKYRSNDLMKLCVQTLKSIMLQSSQDPHLTPRNTISSNLSNAYNKFCEHFPLPRDEESKTDSLCAEGENEGDDAEDADSYEMSEAHTLLIGMLQHEKQHSVQLLEQKHLLSEGVLFCTLDRWTSLCLRTRYHHVTLSIESPLIAAARTLSSMSNHADRLRIYETLQSAAQGRAQGHVQPSLCGDVPIALVSDRVDLERAICHTAQLATTPGENNPWDATSFVCLAMVSIPGLQVAHCCNPCLGFEALRVERGRGQGKLRAVVNLIALRRINLSEEGHTRQYNRVSTPMGSEPCTCPSCMAESKFSTKSTPHGTTTMGRESSDTRSFSAMKLLAFAALGQQDFPRAIRLLRSLLPIARETPSIDNGDVFHAMGAALLSKGWWRQVHSIWKDGLELYPHHSGLTDAVARVKIFALTEQQLSPSGDIIECHTLQYKTSRPSHVCVIMSKQRVVRAEVCAWIIGEAEKFVACAGGWTTARHYAVPTTDLPVSAMPLVLTWFKTWMCTWTGTLSKHFFDGKAIDVCIHDAFVVKYSCHDSASSDETANTIAKSSQTHLPLHQDESTHSLIVALNGPSEYEGGGTYFQALGHSVRPSPGGVLGFDGSLVHGGDPITRGTRYIIAVFLMIHETDYDGGSSMKSRCRESASASAAAGDHESVWERRKIQRINEAGPKLSSEAEGGFSFSFSLDKEG